MPYSNIFRSVNRVNNLLVRVAGSTNYRVSLSSGRAYLSSKTNDGNVHSMTFNVRIGCASGFWGDTPTAVGQLILKGKLDFLVLDYLSEVTMSLLVGAQGKNPDLGFCPDFVQALTPFLPQVKEQGIKIITNSGGVNPSSCMKALLLSAEKMGVSPKIALITGDNLLEETRKMTISSISSPADITSSNAYLGAGPIARALDLGADIVVTGRCTDSALALGPLIHKFKWSQSNFDLMAKGSLAGHLIECGAQASGGIFTDWESVQGWEYNGFPIAIVSPAGDLKITKPEGTGGLVNRGTVSEQLLYEIGDPAAYQLPDVLCDFSQVRVEEEGKDLVKVTGAKGRPPTDFYKVGGTYQDGWKATAVCPIIGLSAREKGRKTAEALIKRSQGLFKFLKMNDFERTFIQILGSEEAYGENARPAALATRDAVLWLSAHHKEKKALEIFGREIASAGTGMAPGLTAVVGGRPRPQPLLRFFSFLHEKKKMGEIKIQTSDGHQETWTDPLSTFSSPTPLNDISKISERSHESPVPASGSHSYALSTLCFLRSGDKGDSCNIGVIPRNPSSLPFIRSQLTEEKVGTYFSHKFDLKGTSIVKRYDVPGLPGLNFVLEGSLGGGGIASLNSDPQGKGYAQMLADFVIKDVPKLG